MKTRFTRFVTSFALLFAILAGNITTIFADSGDIATYARTCQCGNGTLQYYKTSYGEWLASGEVKCPDHPYGTDKVFKRNVYTTYKCNYCGRGYTTTSTQTKKECHGYN